MKPIFTLFYAGVLNRSRPMNLEKVFAAIEDLQETRLIIAGYGDQAEDIKQWANNSSGRAEFIGKIEYGEVLKRSIKCDLLFALYDPVVPSVRYASCNKVFEAMMCGKPILISKNLAATDIVNRERCGISVDSCNVDEIKKAIIKLRDDLDLRMKLGFNGRRAYEERYNRDIMDNRLLSFYRRVINNVT